MSTLKLKTPAGGSISLTPTDTASDVTLTLPASTTSLVDSATLAASGGSALVGYLPAGTGAVATTVQGKLQESVSVKDFGAVGDEVTDDTAAIQAAFDYAATNQKSVYFPHGIYLISSILTSKSVSFFGDGRTSSYIKGSNIDANLVTFQCAYTSITPFFIRDMGFSGGNYQLLTHNAEPADIRNCDFANPKEAGIRAGTNAFNWTVEGNRFIGGRFNIEFRNTGPSVPLNVNSPLGASITGQLCSLIGNWYIGADQTAIFMDTCEGLNIIGGYLELCAANDSGGNTAWAATTAKTVNAIVNINSGAAYGYVYRCTVAGTTAGSVPTATSGTVTDGSVTWEVLGRRACIWVSDNRGFRVTHMQGERNAGTPWMILNGNNVGTSPSTYYYASIIANNSIRQTYPAVGIEINNENRVFISNNHFIDNNSCISIPSTSTVEGLQFTNNIYQNTWSVNGSLSNSIFQNNIQQTSSDVFSLVTNYSEAYSNTPDRYIEAQFIPNPNSTYTKTYTLASTYDAFKVGLIGIYEIQIGYYEAGVGFYRLSTYELDVTKGYNNGFNITFTKVSGAATVAWTSTTNTATSFSGGFTLTSLQGVMIRVIRKTPLAGQAASISSLTHTIS